MKRTHTRYFQVGAQRGKQNILSGFSGTGKSFLLYEATLLLSTFFMCIRVNLVRLNSKDCSSLKNLALKILTSLKFVFPEFKEFPKFPGRNNWDSLIEACFHEKMDSYYYMPFLFRNISKFCKTSKSPLTWIFIVDQLNELLKNSDAKTTFSILNEWLNCCPYTLYCQSANNQHFDSYFSKFTRLFLNTGFSEAEAFTFLLHNLSAGVSVVNGDIHLTLPSQLPSTDDAPSQSQIMSSICIEGEEMELINGFVSNLRYYCNNIPLLVDLFAQQFTKATSLHQITCKSSTKMFNDYMTSFTAEIRSSFDKFLSTQSEDYKKIVYDVILAAVYELPGDFERQFVNLQYLYFHDGDYSKSVKPMSELVRYSLQSIYWKNLGSFQCVEKIQDILQHLKSGNPAIPHHVEAIILLSIRERMLFEGEYRLYSEKRAKMVKLSLKIESVVMLSSVQFEFADLNEYQEVTYFFPTISTFPYVDCFIYDPNNHILHVFQITIHGVRKKASAFQFISRFGKFIQPKVRIQFYYIGKSDLRLAREDTTLAFIIPFGQLSKTVFSQFRSCQCVQDLFE